MKWIEYDYVCNEDKGITLHKKVEYNEANLAVAEVEACDGNYTIVEDGEEIAREPLSIELGGTGASDAASARAALGAAAASHGTHVTFATTTPKAAGTAAVGTATTVSRSDHVHPAQTTVSGNAGSATKLATARNVTVNLASTAAASFDGSADITPGVSGTLPVARGGTGKSSFAAYKILVPSGSTTISQLNFPTVAGSVLRQGTSGAPYWTSLEDLVEALGISSVGGFELLAEYKTAGTYTASIPDDCLVYALIIGGGQGGSGGNGGTSYTDDGEGGDGGAGGCGTFIGPLFSSKITNKSIVVGAGGAGGAGGASGADGTAGAVGGSSSAFGFAACGGANGNTVSLAGATMSTKFPIYLGGEGGTYGNATNAAGKVSTDVVAPIFGFVSAGGGAGYGGGYINSSGTQTIAPSAGGTGATAAYGSSGAGGNGGSSSSAAGKAGSAATGNGCGGGGGGGGVSAATASKRGAGGKGGSGGPGYVAIYIQRGGEA